VHYGTTINKFDITDEIKSVFLTGDRLFINKYTYFNIIKGDPAYGEKKQIFLKYEIKTNSATHIIEEIHPEVLKHNIVIDVSNAEYIFKFINLNDIYSKNNADIFEEILLKIQYVDEFKNFSSNTIQKIKPTFNIPSKLCDISAENSLCKKINVIHLRVENDAIDFWSSINNMTYSEFQMQIEAKYIELIKKYMDKRDKIVILSNSSVNGVVEFLVKNNYDIVISEKYFDCREKNAIVDLLVSRVCNNVFLGCINNKIIYFNNFSFIMTGSTFSYYISKLVDKSVKKIGIIIDCINADECVFY
jgi:hypothetical protein